MSEVSRYGQSYKIPDEIVAIPGRCTIDFKAHKVTAVDGKEKKLTPKFLILLAYFCDHKGKCLSSETILKHMFPDENMGAIDQIKGMVFNLRKILNDTQPYSVIVEEHGYGYKFVLCEDDQTSTPPKREPPGRIPSGYALEPPGKSPVKNRMPLEAKSRSERVATNFQIALKRLVEASDFTQFKVARLHILQAIKIFVNEIKFLYARNVGDYDDDAWEKEKRHYEDWFFYAIRYGIAEVEAIEQSDELMEVKLNLLYDIMQWHFLTAMLRAQLDLEKQAFEASGELIGKEIRQTRINKLEENYQIAQTNANMAEAALDKIINGYDQGLSADKPSI